MQELFDFPAGKLPPADSDLKTDCPACGLKQSLYEATISAEDEDTLYNCHGCGELFAVVSKEPTTKWTGSGYMFGKYAVRLKCTLTTFTRQMRHPMQIPGKPDACTRKPD